MNQKGESMDKMKMNTNEQVTRTFLLDSYFSPVKCILKKWKLLCIAIVLCLILIYTINIPYSDNLTDDDNKGTDCVTFEDTSVHSDGYKSYLVSGVRYSLNPWNLCNDNVTKPFILIIVTSSTNNFLNRQAIRSTWGKSTSSIRIAFLMGHTKQENVMLKIREEFHNHSDIIQGNFLDSYRNLTIKSLILLNWTAEYCSKATFVLKCDDDVYVNVPKLIQAASSLKADDVLIGRYILNRVVVRNVASKWYVSRNSYYHRRWPMYLRGQSYLVRTSIIHKYLPLCVDYSHIPMEDVVITGLCAEDLDFKRKELPGYNLFITEIQSPCIEDAITVVELQLMQFNFLHQKVIGSCHSTTHQST